MDRFSPKEKLRPSPANPSARSAPSDICCLIYSIVRGKLASPKDLSSCTEPSLGLVSPSRIPASGIGLPNPQSASDTLENWFTR